MSEFISEETLTRLKREREEAEARYNDALSALDRAKPAFSPLPEPDQQATEVADEPAFEPPFDAGPFDVAPILPPDPLVSYTGWRRRFAGFIWRFVGPMLQRQQEVNSELAARLRGEEAARNEAYRQTIAAHRRVVAGQLAGQLAAQHQTIAARRQAREDVESAFAALARLHGHLMHYLQQVTLFVETKDREAAGEMHKYLRHLGGGLSGLADELAKRWESIAAHEQRRDARVTALADAQAKTASDVQGSIASLTQLSHVMKREMERLLASGASTAASSGSETARRGGACSAPAGGASAPAGGEPRSARTPAGDLPADTGALDSYKYASFEDRFRGSEDDIRARFADYLPLFEGASDVLDVGCGRGEFLELLGGRGIKAQGIDINHEMVERCRARGLDVAQGDALDYLASLPDGSLGGLFAAQVVEHLEPDRLIRLLDVAFSKLRPGSRIVLETINPACWAAFFESYIRDLTHVRPIHPDTLKFLLHAAGFQAADVQYRAPYPDTARLQPIAVPAPTSAEPTSGEWTLVEVAEAFNANVTRLNALLFTYLDYAAIATRG